jgi:hypothetical protein
VIISEFNQMKASGRYNDSVLAPLQILVNAANSTLLEIKAAMESDDYVSAQSLISQVNASISNAKSEMDDAQLSGSPILGFTQGIWFWVAIVVIIVFVLGFFVYMFYPTKTGGHGYQPEKGFTHPTASKGEGIGAKIKKAFKRKKKAAPQTTTTDFAKSMTAQSDDGGHFQTFHYSEGYKKERSYGYDYRGGNVLKGLFQKLQKLRGKQEKLPQMHLDQFSKQPVAEQEEEASGQASQASS